MLVEPIPVATKTKSGLIIPDKSREKPKSGTVLAIGSLTEVIQKGDTVLYPPNVGTKVLLDGKDFIILREDELLAII